MNFMKGSTYLRALLFLVATNAFAQQSELVSVNADGTKSNQQSTWPDISADGRYVAFMSAASNLVTNDTANADIFVKDRVTGQVELVSKASDGTFANSSSSRPITISADGRYVTFMSFATNLVPNDTNGFYDLFWHDRVTGETRQVNVADDGTQANHFSDFAAVSGDGRYVAFRSSASNLVPDGPSNNQVYLRDMQLGMTRLVSRNASGIPQGGGEPDISSDGRYVVYRGLPGVHVVDTLNCSTAACAVQRVDLNNAGQPVSGHTSGLLPKISGNGQYVAWESDAAGYVANDTNGAADIFVRDTLTSLTSRVSVASDAAQANGFSLTPDISDDGRYVVFTSSATNLAGPDTNGVLDIFLHDRQESQTTRITQTDAGGQLNNSASFYSRISGSGQQVAFSTNASNVLLADTDATEDVYVISLAPPNGSPVAEAGENIEVAVGERVTLNGFNSTDDTDSANSLTYEWTLVAFPQGSVAILSSLTSASTAFNPDLPGEYRVELVVTDTNGATSTPDNVEVLAGIVPAYIFKKAAEGTISYSTSGSDYSYDSDYPQALASDEKEVMFRRDAYSYDSATQIVSSDYSINESDGTVTDKRLARDQSLSPTDTLNYFSDTRRMADGALRFSGSIRRVYAGGARSVQGAWEVDQDGSVAPLLEFPIPVTGEDRTLSYGWGFRFSGNAIAFTTYPQPYTFKEWYWIDSLGLTRTSRYYDQEVYVERNGQATRVWDAVKQIPGLNQSAYSIQVEDVTDAGDVLIRTSFPRGSTGRWDSALVKVDAAGNASTIVETTETGDFPDYYISQVEFDGHEVLVSLNGPVNGRYEQSIYRDSGSGLQRFIAGPYLSTSGSSSYSYLNSWGYSVLNGDFLLSGYPNIMARIDGRIRRVATGGEQLDSERPDYLFANAHSGNDLIGGKFVAFGGREQTLWNYVSSSEYSYAYNYWVFHGKLDTDRDLVPDDLDNCPIRPNPTQLDSDGNGIGDLCEDSDADGYFDPADNCPVVANTDQLYSDTDPFGDACDVCPLVADDQSDLDGDGIGDACDSDRDGDGLDDVIDDCPVVFNPAPQFDLDTDGMGDLCDPDKDGDGIVNEVDGTFDGTTFTDQSGTASKDFTDEHRGGSSFGSLLGGANVNWVVEDGQDASVGLLISSTGQGRLRACGDNKLITWPGGATAELTCGSTSIRTLIGLTEVSVDEQEQIVVSVPQGADARIVDEPTGEFAVLVSPLSGPPVEIQISNTTRLEIERSTTAIIEEVDPGQYNITNSSGSDGSISVTIDGATMIYQAGDQGIPVLIDIKPGDGQNSINLGSGGNVPVAIYSSSSFDATTINPLSISLASANVQLKGKGTPQIAVEDLNADGLDDLIVHVDTSALELSPDAENAVLEGSTFNGIPIRGSDTVVIVSQ